MNLNNFLRNFYFRVFIIPKEMIPTYRQFKNEMRDFSVYFHLPDFYIFIPCVVSALVIFFIALCDVFPAKILESTTVSFHLSVRIID